MNSPVEVAVGDLHPQLAYSFRGVCWSLVFLRFGGPMSKWKTAIQSWIKE